MKSKFTKSLLKHLCIFCIAILPFFSTTASAQADVVNAINQIRARIDAIVQTVAFYIFKTPQNIGNTLITNITTAPTGPIPTSVKAIVTQYNDQDISSGLAPDVKNPNAPLIQMASIKAPDTLLPSVRGGVLPLFASSSQSDQQNELIKGEANFNFQSLLTPVSYTTDTVQQNYALNYIRFLSGFATPISNFSLKDIPESQLSANDKLDVQNSADYQSYQVKRRALVAQQSAALSNLYYLYAKRLPITSIKAADTALAVDSPSALQIEEYIATWRSTTPSWYIQMSTESPTNIAREAVFILAEIQKQLYNLHRDNERIIALLAINQLGGVQTGKINLGLAEKQLQARVTERAKNVAKNKASALQQQTQEQAKAQGLKQTQQQQPTTPAPTPAATP